MSKSEKNDTLLLILPFILFMVLTSFETSLANVGISYPWAYTGKIALTVVAVLICFPSWKGTNLPFRWTRWTSLALGLGAVSTILWVLLATIHLEIPGLSSGVRVAFNPWETPLLTTDTQRWGFWGIRMCGLALVVPMIEEMFLRGFLLRWIQSENWTSLSVGNLSAKAWCVVILYGALTHPEILAAIVWFTLVTLYVRKTGNIWDAILFHVGTNATLGFWVLASGQWQLM